eukprot:SAG31_NODE_14173_length_823_cov_1.736188_1_plen_74_part_00
MSAVESDDFPFSTSRVDFGVAPVSGALNVSTPDASAFFDQQCYEPYALLTDGSRKASNSIQVISYFLVFVPAM